ncbi:MAG: RNA methyltransferase [Sandaracinaceae bacterium]
MTPLYVALIHHPVRARDGSIVTTAVTNLDVHDIARSARTYGLAGYFVVTPIEAQRRLVHRILEHWTTGAGARRTPERTEALALCHVVHDLQAAIGAIREQTGRPPRLWATSARRTEGVPRLTLEEARRGPDSGPTLLLFGTGHGLVLEAIDGIDAVLPPIRGSADYNHLSVRAAVAILLDRLVGEHGSR